MGYYDDVLKALSGNTANPVPADDAIKTMKIIEAASSSADTGKVIAL
jgi:predicted dehydrogenase